VIARGIGGTIRSSGDPHRAVADGSLRDGDGRRLDLPDRLLAAAALLMLAAGIWCIGGAAWMQGKAVLAQVLIQRAWATNVDDGKPHERPWSWADTTPVGRLEFVRQRRSMIVLAGDSGRILAFGPGHRTGSALPGASGNSVISAHRDTHFAVLRNVRIGDLVRVENIEGHTVSYRIDALDVVDEHDLSVTEQRGSDQLTLVTCWPFDAIAPGGPWRYVATASRHGNAGEPTSDER
jgi:sortase A